MVNSLLTSLNFLTNQSTHQSLLTTNCQVNYSLESQIHPLFIATPVFQDTNMSKLDDSNSVLIDLPAFSATVLPTHFYI